MNSFAALVLMCALAAQPILSAPQNPSRLDQSNNGMVDKARLENLDENSLSGPSVINGPSVPSKPTNWKDSQHFVTSDGKGEAKFQAGETASDNGFSKFAEHQLTYDSNANHQPGPDTQVLNLDDFQRRQEELQKQISDFMGDFKLPSLPSFDFSLPQLGLPGNQLNFTGFDFDENLKKAHQHFEEFAAQQRREFEARFKAISEQQRDFQSSFGFGKGLPEAGQQQQLRRYSRQAPSGHQTQEHLDAQIAKITDLANKLVQLRDCSGDALTKNVPVNIANSLAKLTEKFGKIESASHVNGDMSIKVAKVKSSLSADTIQASECPLKKTSVADGAAVTEYGNTLGKLNDEVDHLLEDLA